MPTVIKQYANVLIALAVVAAISAAGWFVYNKGYASADSAWQLKWATRDAADAKATADRQQLEREKEQARQRAIDEASTHAQEEIEHAAADAAASHATANSLRDAAEQLTGQLERSEASRSTCTAESSKAATSAARMLADVLKLADQRAGRLAEIADQARIRGIACERAYDSIRSNQ